MTFLDVVTGTDLAYPRGAFQAGIAMDLIADEALAYEVNDPFGEPVWVADTTTADQALYWGGTGGASGAGSAALTYDFYARDNVSGAFVVRDDETPTSNVYINVITLDGNEGIDFGNAAKSPLIRFVTTADVHMLGGALRMTETTKPTGVTNNGFIYTKNDGSNTELYFVDENDLETQITLDGSVNAGGGVPHSLTGNGNVIVDDTSENWMVFNETAGNFTFFNQTDDPSAMIFDGLTSLAWTSGFPIRLGRQDGANPATGSNTISIGDTQNLVGSPGVTTSVFIGGIIRFDGSVGDNVFIGHNTRGHNGDIIIGPGTQLTGTIGSNVSIGGTNLTTGNNNVMIGTFINASDAVNCILMGTSALPGSTSTNSFFLGGLTAARQINTIMFGSGGNGDSTNGTLRIFEVSPKITSADLKGTLRISSGGSTGSGGTTIDMYAAATNFASATTQHPAERVANFEAFGSAGNPVEFGLHIGNQSGTASADAYLYFEAATGAALRQAFVFLDGSTSNMITRLPAGGSMVYGGAIAIDDFYFGEGISIAGTPNGATLHATAGSGANPGSLLTLTGGEGGQAGQDGGGVKLLYADENTLTTGLHVYGGLAESTSFPAGSVELGRGIGATCRIVPISATTANSAFVTIHSIAVGSDRHIMVKAYIMGTKSAAGGTNEGWASFELFASIHNDSGTTDEDNAGTAFLASTDGIANRASQAGSDQADTDTWDLRISADDGSDEVDIEVGGTDSENVNWRGFLIVWEGV